MLIIGIKSDNENRGKVQTISLTCNETQPKMNRNVFRLGRFFYQK